MDDQGNEPGRFALLIGINRYAKQPLTSCVRDIQGVTRCLKNTSDNIRITELTADTAPVEPSGTGFQEDLPTFNRIIEGLRNIAASAGPGDFVYIHFSGHGTRAEAGQDDNANHQPGDLALVVLTDPQDGARNVALERYLWGETLAEEIGAMVGKKLHVTLVLDCCHSGGIMRGSPPSGTTGSLSLDHGEGERIDFSEVRYLKYDPNVDAAFPRDQEEGLPARLVDAEGVARGHFRDACMLPTWMVRPEGYTIITACGPLELAGHLHVGGVKYGALSYFLVKALGRRQFGGFLGNLELVYEETCSRFLNAPKSIAQMPMWYGKRTREFFGADISSGLSRRSIFSVIQTDKYTFRLDGGRAHGIRDGDEFEISSVHRQDLSISGMVGVVGGLSSSLNIEDPSFVAKMGGPIATPRTAFALRRWPVKLDLAPGSDAAGNEWDVLKRKRPWISFEDTEHPFWFRVSSAGAAYQIRDGSGSPVEGLLSEYQDAEQTIKAIEHMARFQSTKARSNEGVTAIPQCSYNVQLVNLDQEQAFQAGQLAEVREGDKLQFIMTNNSSDALYFHIFNLCPAWNIANSLNQSYKVVERGRSRRGPKLVIKAPEGSRYHTGKGWEEIFKVFITRRPTSFECLRLPKLGTVEIMDLQTQDLRGDNKAAAIDLRHLEDWAVMDFQVVCKREPPM